MSMFYIQSMDNAEHTPISIVSSLFKPSVPLFTPLKVVCLAVHWRALLKLSDWPNACPVDLIFCFELDHSAQMTKLEQRTNKLRSVFGVIALDKGWAKDVLESGIGSKQYLVLPLSCFSFFANCCLNTSHQPYLPASPMIMSFHSAGTCLGEGLSCPSLFASPTHQRPSTKKKPTAFFSTSPMNGLAKVCFFFALVFIAQSNNLWCRLCFYMQMINLGNVCNHSLLQMGMETSLV